MARTRENGAPHVHRVQMTPPTVEPASVTARGTGDGVADGPAEDAIRLRAYELFLQRGGAPGHELDDWLAAERALRTAGPDEPS